MDAGYQLRYLFNRQLLSENCEFNYDEILNVYFLKCHLEIRFQEDIGNKLQKQRVYQTEEIRYIFD